MIYNTIDIPRRYVVVVVVVVVALHIIHRIYVELQTTRTQIDSDGMYSKEYNVYARI
jgi:hypothetical protein